MSKKKWTTFIHNGVYFSPPYIPHNIPIIYDNKEYIFKNKLAEEAATFYAKYLDTEYIVKQNNTFNKNFWKDWKKILGPNHLIKSLEKCDFSKIYDYLIQQKIKKQNMSKEQKEEIKKLNEQKFEKYKYAIVDGIKQPVSNFRIEPPGIFIGRGCHPKLGSIKKRIKDKDVTLNLSKDADIPNGDWKEIIHDNTLTWLASWKDTITGKIKYVWLSSKSNIQQQSDIDKFEMARKLKKKIHKIRKINEQNLSHSNIKIKQIATVVYFIDNFALRVGSSDKQINNRADTVGITNLRCEHITIIEETKCCKIKLDFLGKDSIRYVKKLKVSEQVYNNLLEFTKNKNKKEHIFDKIISTDVNKYLRKFVRKLSAKVFRTLNASYRFQKELNSIIVKLNKSKVFTEASDSEKLKILINEYNIANTKIADLCNHQKKVSKSFNSQIEKINEQIKKYISKAKKKKGKSKEKIKQKIKLLKAKKKMKLEQKNLSLGTSKINYIDPRITIAFMKKNNIDMSNIDKFFSKTLQEKFKWAMDTDSNFKF